VRDAVFGNAGTLVCFRIGAADAEFLESEFKPSFIQDDLVNLTKYNIALKLMIDGIASNAFSAITLPPLPQLEESHREKIIRVSQERYGKPEELISGKISRWTSAKEAALRGSDDASGGYKESGGGSNASANKPSLEFDAVCSQCGKDTKLSFKPDGRRPVYCRECFAKIKEGEITPAAPKEISLSEATQSHPSPSAGALQAPNPSRASLREPAFEGRERPSGRRTEGSSESRTAGSSKVSSRDEGSAGHRTASTPPPKPEVKREDRPRIEPPAPPAPPVRNETTIKTAASSSTRKEVNLANLRETLKDVLISTNIPTKESEDYDIMEEGKEVNF